MIHIPPSKGKWNYSLGNVGLTPLEAIHAATMISARTMKLEKEMGSIEPGKLANLVFLSANPIEDIGAMRKITLTVKRGQQYPRSQYRPIEKSEVENRM